MLKLLQEDRLQPLLFSLLIISARVCEFLAQPYWTHPALPKHLQKEACFFTFLFIADGKGKEDGSCYLELRFPHFPPSLLAGADNEYNEIGFLLEVSCGGFLFICFVEFVFNWARNRLTLTDTVKHLAMSTLYKKTQTNSNLINQLKYLELEDKRFLRSSQIFPKEKVINHSEQ